MEIILFIIVASILSFLFVATIVGMICPSTKCRIVKETNQVGKVQYIIEQKHFVFRWQWVPASINAIEGVSYCQDYFDTYEEAVQHLPYFNGTKCKRKIVENYE